MDMPWRAFHDPDICLPVVARRATEHALDLIAGIGEILATGGRSLTWNTTARMDSPAAHYTAVTRLRKAGLIASRGRNGRSPVLILTEAGEAGLAWGARPHAHWDRRWNGIWYVLAYDVPEADRKYRNALRLFLHRLHMGCLQRSVWVTHRDIRPEYDDLVHGAAVDAFSFLLEATTVLGRSSQDIVRQAWGVDRLERVQGLYIEVFEENLARVLQERDSPADLMALAGEEAAAYRAAMAEDPLLPRGLWPPGYLGPQAYDLHERCIRTIAERL
jgi:phenylacetic acid degradation operon negative regulatory protein